MCAAWAKAQQTVQTEAAAKSVVWDKAGRTGRVQGRNGLDCPSEQLGFYLLNTEGHDQICIHPFI